MKTEYIISHICNWLKNYAIKSKKKGFVVGVSGGVDSAVTSALVAKTGMPLLCVEMPIHQKETELQRGEEHIKWMKKNYKNVDSLRTDLSCIFNDLSEKLQGNKKINELALANTKARLRMITLYYLAQTNNYLVTGTGNKVEDFGIGFFTKYGDGGVDISPIADLLKTEVYQIGEFLDLNQNILSAPPTDGLWKCGKTDEEQIGASYTELEWAMNYKGNPKYLNSREKKVLNIYKNFNSTNQHKMHAIPICKIPKHLK